MAEKQAGKTNWGPVAGITLGVAGVGTGLYFWLRKPKGVDQGGTVAATFKFHYEGEGGDYVLQVSLGRVILSTQWFDHIAGMTWTRTVTLPGPDDYKFTVDCPLSEAARPDKYDGEALIRTPDMAQFDYLKKVLGENVITVRAA